MATTAELPIQRIEADSAAPDSPKKPGNFYVLRQDGIVAAGRDLQLGPGSIGQEAWGKVNRTDKAKVRQMRDQVVSILGIDSMNQIPQLLTDQERQQTARTHAYELIGNMYGIEAKPDHKETPGEEAARLERIESRVKGFAEVANGVIDKLASGVLSGAPANVEMINVVKDTHDPVTLTLITLDNNYDQRARFEAKRKLVLMNLTGAIDQREREIGVDTKVAALNQFLDKYVLNQVTKVGEAQDVTLHSTHNAESFAVESVTILTPEETQEIELLPFEKLTPLSRRTFQSNGHEIPLYIHTRKKDAVTKVLKLLRKGRENPALAVDDELGFMAVFDSRSDIGKFKRYLNQSAARAGTMLDMLETEDTLDGRDEHKTTDPGSSTKLRQDKTHIRLDGIVAEGIFHTNETYLDQRYQRGVAHEEFEVRRLFDSGVVSLLFPPDIYPYNEARVEDGAIRRVRQAIETTY